MIGKVSIGKTFRGCVNYVMGKQGAEVLQAHGVRSESALFATRDFDSIRKQNKSISNAVWHTSISFAYQDQVTDDLMKKVSSDYLDQLKLKDHQYIIVKHNDTAHQHVHIISNRVGFNGEVVSDRWCKNRTARACDIMEEKYNLTVAREQGRGLSPAQDKRPEIKQAKDQIAIAVKGALEKGISRYDTLIAELRKRNIDLQLQKQSTGRVNGITFRKGEFIVKGSAVSKEFSYKRLLKHLEMNKGKQLGYER